MDNLAKIINEELKRFIKEDIQETSRRQKAQQAILGNNKRVKTICIMSAENPMGQQMDKEYNKNSVEQLIHQLQIGGFKWFKTKGLYGSPENSIMIYNISLEDSKMLAYQYNQESMIFIDITNEGEISYQYWEGDDHNSQLKLQHEEHEIVNAQNDNDYYTAISKHFKFRIPFFESYKKVADTLNEKAEKYSNIAKMIDESMDMRYTGKHRYITRWKLYGNK